jgi:sn-glycerol 3-phosphate transport system ATP-binding protein
LAGISIRNVRKVYAGNVEAVKGISFDIPDAAFCVIVGPSGCGKTTLLRMIAGLESITAGEIAIGGRVVNEVEPAERDIAMVFQNYALYPHMRVYDNLAYGLRNRGTPKDEIEKRVQEAARLLELSHLLQRRPRELSGGQRQRVAMGRAIVRRPQAFLFDEPLSNLDAKLRVQTRIQISHLQRNLGTTSVYVTHDQLEAMTLADMLVVMNAGAVEQVGPPLELYRKPATVFVATFLGAPAMNILPVEADGAGAVRLENGSSLALPAGVSVPPGGALLGVRPEDLEENAAVTNGGIAFDVTVEAVEALGAESFLYGKLGDRMLVLRSSGHLERPVGSRVKVAAAASRLHFFDKETGKRL